MVRIRIRAQLAPLRARADAGDGVEHAPLDAARVAPAVAAAIRSLRAVADAASTNAGATLLVRLACGVDPDAAAMRGLVPAVRGVAESRAAGDAGRLARVAGAQA